MLGDFSVGASVHADFGTVVNGAGATLTGGVVSVYKNGGLTQSVAGVTLTADFDGVVGSHHVAIDTSADGAFYSAGAQFNIRLTAGTVNGISGAGRPIDSFTLGLSSTLDAAGIRSAVGLASANLDTQLDAVPTNAELATALGTADDAVLAQVALVKAKTDSLTFTVAGAVDANVQRVNDVNLQGVGTVGSPWRPA